MNKRYKDFITSDKAQKIFGFKNTKLFLSMDITFVIITMGRDEEYHMMFSMCPRWNKPAIQFFDQKFSDKDRMPYGKRWSSRKIKDGIPFINAGDELYQIDDYAKFSCVNYLIHGIEDKSIFMLPVAGSTPILKKLSEPKQSGDSIQEIPSYA